MIRKFALSDCVPLLLNSGGTDLISNDKNNMVRTAAGKVIIEPGSDKARILEAEIKKHPTALFFRAKAIEANKHNTNGDYFSEEELLSSYKSFEGVPFFTNHENQDIEKAKGKIIFAEWNPEEKAVYTISFVDREAYPHICRSIEEGYASGVSMGCSVEYSVCNLCGNKAEKTEDYCFVPGTTITMSDLSVKNIEDIAVGDDVLDAFGKPTKVVQLFKHEISENVQKITSKAINGELVCTSNHPFLVERRDELRFVPCEYLQEKETLLTPIAKINVDNSLFDVLEKYSIENSEENRLKLSKLIGYFIAEGCILRQEDRGDIGLELCFHKDEIDYVNEIINICETVFNKTPEIIDRSTNDRHKCRVSNSKQIRIYNKFIVDLINKSCVGLAKEKTLSKEIISLDKKYLQEVLAGYIDGDGYSDEYGRLILTTSSRNLAHQLMYICNMFGVPPSIYSYLQNGGPNNRDVINYMIFKVSVANLQTLPLKNSSIKAKKSTSIAKTNSNISRLKNAFSIDGFVKHSAYGIDEVYYSGSVYNFETESNSYVANNTSVHNCTHIRNRKGRKFTGSVRNVTTGETKQFKDEPVFEYNYGIKFIELSAVVDPACPSCRIQGIIPCDEYMKKAANIENSLRMVRTAAIEKQASKEEIDQIEQAIGTLESIAINLIKNRKQVEVSFASDLVEILANLQEWNDELVGAGYGNLQNAVPGTEEPGTAGAPPETGLGDLGGLGDATGAPDGAPPAGTPPSAGAPPAGAPAPAPVASSTSAPVGQVAGKATTPLVKGPQRPNLPITSPPRVGSSESDRIVKANKIIESASKLISNINIHEEDGEENMGKRRTLTEKNAQIEKTKQILSELWQEKQEFCEYMKEVPSVKSENCRLAVKRSDDTFVIVAESSIDDEVKVWRFEDLSSEEKSMIKSNPKVAASMLLQNFQNKKLEGENRMSENTKQAGASSINSNLDVVQEKQLDAKDLYHPRTGEEQDSVTQKQLESKRKNNEKDVVTQKQLDEKIRLHPRTGEEKDVVTQKQLDDVRENTEKETVTQDQLKGNRIDSEQDVVTQKQLDNIAAPWARAASRDASQFKTASDHMQSVIEVMADTAIETGSTPQELQTIAATLVAGTKARYDLAMAITEESKKTSKLPYAERLAFWANKNIKFASASVADVEQILIGKLKVVASDTTINPDIIVEAVDVVGEDANALDSISIKIDEKLQSKASVEVKKSVKSELRSALKPVVTSTKEEREVKRQAILASVDGGKQTRDAERSVWEKKIASKLFDPTVAKKADTVIEATFSEIGSTKDSPSFKKDIFSFAKGALSAHNVKLASIVNVTISDDTVQIAVQTENEEGSKESFEFPLGEENAPSAEEEVPEGDVAGEGLEDTLGGAPAPASSATPAPSSGGVAGGVSTPPPPAPGPMASSKKTMKTAQAPSGGGIPNAPAGGAPDQAGALGGPAPAGETPVQSLMGGSPEGAEGEDAADEEIPTVGEKQMPWTICPECGSSDVDVTKDETGGIKGTCNACSAEYEAMIKKLVEFKIIKPTTSVGEEGTEVPETPEAPEMPALPVAASTRLSKDTIVRIASNRKANGHVCPSCGHKNCKASVENEEHTECTCDSCRTSFSKDIVVNSKNPEEAYLMVQWDLTPEAGCKDCLEKASKFASKVKVSQMLKTASDNSEQFPMANCVERIAREYGSDTVGSFGPCKGKLVAECVCKQLQRVGLSKVRHLERLAKASLQADPMDECIADQKKQGYTVKEACSICGVIKKKFASEVSDNIFVHAFADDIASKKIKDLTLEDLMNISDMTLGEAAGNESEVPAVDGEADFDEDIKDAALPEASEVSVEVEETIDGEEKLCNKCKQEKCICGDKPKDTSESTDLQEPEVVLEGEEGENMKEDLLASSSRVKRSEGSSIRLAEKPKKVETIEGNVGAGVPRSKSLMGNEGADNIDVPMAKPSVPRKESYMGKEKDADSMISATLELPDVAKDSSYMGHEKEIQNGMPGINNEIKGTVIADSRKTEKQAKKLKEIDTIEKDVEAGIPRGKATIGNEGKDNIDVDMANPDVPRSDAYMGKEKDADSMINEKLDGPDVPMGDGYMGKEKETQKGMPANNDEYLKLVKQKKDVQIERIAQARRESARDTASWLASNGRIASDRGTFDSVVKALSAFEIDKIQAVADQMFPERTKKVATASTGHSIPAIVMESKVQTGNDLQSKLANQFTIGNSKFDQSLTMYGEKDAK